MQSVTAVKIQWSWPLGERRSAIWPGIRSSSRCGRRSSVERDAWRRAISSGLVRHAEKRSVATFGFVGSCASASHAARMITSSPSTGLPWEAAWL